MFTNRKIFDKLQDEIENYLSKEQKMRVNRNKLKIAMAKACMNTSDLQKASEMPRPTVNNVVSGKNSRPGTIGRIAKALGVDVTEIIDDID